MHITHDNGCGFIYRFEIVEKIPPKYSIWNIRQMEENPDYLPLCICYPGTRNVITDKLLAVRMDPEEVSILLKASALGACNLSSARRYISRKSINPVYRERAEKAIPILEKYTD